MLHFKQERIKKLFQLFSEKKLDKKSNPLPSPKKKNPPNSLQLKNTHLATRKQWFKASAKIAVCSSSAPFTISQLPITPSKKSVHFHYRCGVVFECTHYHHNPPLLSPALGKDNRAFLTGRARNPFTSHVLGLSSFFAAVPNLFH